MVIFQRSSKLILSHYESLGASPAKAHAAYPFGDAVRPPPAGMARLSTPSTLYSSAPTLYPGNPFAYR
eukprot:g1037.t1